MKLSSRLPFLCLHLSEDAQWRIEGMPPTHWPEGKQCVSPDRKIGQAAPLKRSMPHLNHNLRNVEHGDQAEQDAPNRQAKEG